MSDTKFLETITAAKHVGLTLRQFTTAIERLNELAKIGEACAEMKPIIFTGSTTDKHFWLREELDKRADELRANIGNVGRPKYQPARRMRRASKLITSGK